MAFDLTGDQKVAYNQVPAVEKAISSVGQRHPGFSVAETGSASVGKALDKVFAEQLKQAGLLSLPLTMLIPCATYHFGRCFEPQPHGPVEARRLGLVVELADQIERSASSNEDARRRARTTTEQDLAIPHHLDGF